METNKSLNISVILISFNHKDYIEKAIESVLSQVTDLNYEIIVHDDASTDGTRAIIERYVELYPGRIIPILREANMYGQGVSPFAEPLKIARGEYVALCECDDYWVSTNKIQSQYDIMINCPKLSFCCHNAFIDYVDTGKRTRFNDDLDSGYYATPDLVTRDWFVPTASLFFKNPEDKDFLPVWFGNVRSQDLVLEIFLSLKGDFFYDNEVRSVYRKNSVGSFSAKNEEPWHYLKLRISLFRKLYSAMPAKYRLLIVRDIYLSYLKIIYAMFVKRKNVDE